MFPLISTEKKKKRVVTRKVKKEKGGPKKSSSSKNNTGNEGMFTSCDVRDGKNSVVLDPRFSRLVSPISKENEKKA